MIGAKIYTALRMCLFPRTIGGNQGHLVSVDGYSEAVQVRRADEPEAVAVALLHIVSVETTVAGNVVIVVLRHRIVTQYL